MDNNSTDTALSIIDALVSENPCIKSIDRANTLEFNSAIKNSFKNAERNTIIPMMGICWRPKRYSKAAQLM